LANSSIDRVKLLKDIGLMVLNFLVSFLIIVTDQAKACLEGKVKEERPLRNCPVGNFRSELLNLKPGDIDSQRGVLLIRQSKGKKKRIVPVSEKLVATHLLESGTDLRLSRSF